VRIGLATIQYGRRLHLARQALAVSRLEALERYLISELSDMDLVVMLHVDCIPDPDILDNYRNAIERIGPNPALPGGPVAYLDALAPSQLALSREDRHRARDNIKRDRTRERGVQLWDVADAWAYHQPHRPATDNPSTVGPIVANLNRFHETWKVWPTPRWVEST
jgi:hypothetical protein